MAEVLKNVPPPTQATFDIVGLTHAEYQVIRNGLFEVAEDVEYTTMVMDSDPERRSQAEIARHLHSRVVRYQSS